MSAPIELTYFDGPGRANLTRLVLAAGGVEFKDNRIPMADWPGLKGDPESAPAQVFGQMPVIKQGKFFVAQSAATALYAAEVGIYQQGVLGTEASEKAQNRATDAMVLGAYSDLQSAMYKGLFGSEESKKSGRDELPSKAKPILEGLERILSRRTGKGPFFYSESKPTVADLAVYDAVTSPFPGLGALGVNIKEYDVPKLAAVVEAVTKSEAVAAKKHWVVPSA